MVKCERPAPSYCATSWLKSYHWTLVNLGSWWTREENGRIYFSSYNEKFCNIFCIRSPWKTSCEGHQLPGQKVQWQLLWCTPLNFQVYFQLAIWNTTNFCQKRLWNGSFYPSPPLSLRFSLWKNLFQNLKLLHTCFFSCRQNGKTVKEDPWKDKKSKGCSLSRYGFSCVFNLPRGPGWGGGILWQTTS